MKDLPCASLNLVGWPKSITESVFAIDLLEHTVWSNAMKWKSKKKKCIQYLLLNLGTLLKSFEHFHTYRLCGKER